MHYGKRKSFPYGKGKAKKRECPKVRRNLVDALNAPAGGGLGNAV